MKVTIEPGKITVEAEHARDAVEVLNSLTARVLDIYATKPEALVEHVAEKREKAKTVHLRSVTGPEVDKPMGGRAAPPAPEPAPVNETAALPVVPPETPGARDTVEVLSNEAEQHIETFGQMQDPEPTLLAEVPRVPEPGVVADAAKPGNGPSSSVDAEAIVALQGATSLRPIFNYFLDRQITDAEGLFAACIRVRAGIPYLASMINFEKRVRTAIAVILEKDIPQSFS